MVKAVIDVGSNSVLLLVEERVQEVWKPICERSAVTGLGAGTKQTGILSEKGMSETLEAIRTFYDLAKELGVQQVMAGATMAARIASNTPDFLNRALAQGTPVEVLDGDEEAQLGFECVSSDPAFKDQPLLSVIDVGGQSTELATGVRNGTQWQVLFRRSFAMGSLALRSGRLKQECPDPIDILQAVVELDESIGMCYLRNRCGLTVILGATGTNLVAIRDRIDPWDPTVVHGAWLGFGEISEAAGQMMRMTEAQRRALPGMEPGREGTLPAGALILERVLNAIGAEGARVSTRGWRHALLEYGRPSLRPAVGAL